MRFATSRFLAALLFLAAGALALIGAFLFSPATERWLGLAAGIAVVSTVLVVIALPGRDAFQRTLDAILLPLGAWTIVSARAVELGSASLTKWLGMSAGTAIAGLGLLSLLAHEISVASELRWALQRLADRAEPEPEFVSHNGHRVVEDYEPHVKDWQP